jgi:bifunctional non-homologous end joining protein LigD
MSTTHTVKVGRKTLSVSNLEKVLYPKTGFTKADVIHYYMNIAPFLLPHMKKRALTLKRYPNGVDQMFFYEKRCPVHRPKWVTTAEVKSGRSNNHINYCVVDDEETLVWVANLASIELHTLLSRVDHAERPTMMVFDLDPGPPAGVLDAMEIAIKLRDLLASVGLQCFPKTSGGKGIHLGVPLNTPGVTFEDTKSFSRGIAMFLEQQYPDRVVSKMLKSLRVGKVFVDWSQNDEYKTTVNVYSLRAREHPTVSTPITWKELETALKKKDPSLVTFEAEDVVKRVKKVGDLYEPLLKLKQRLPSFEKLAKKSA